MNNFRAWMYNRWDSRGFTSEFLTGVEQFCDWAFLQQGQTTILCPCKACDCDWPLKDRSIVTLHLQQYGFRDHYYIWDRHGEDYGQQGVSFDVGGAGPSSSSVQEQEYGFHNDREFVQDWFPQHNLYENEQMMAQPTQDAQDFYALMAAAEQPIHEGHTMSHLYWIRKVMSFKASGATTAQVEDYMNFSRESLLPQHRKVLPRTYYKMKKLMLKLGLGVIKYDVCENNCCLYYKELAQLRACPTCNHPRYKPMNYEAKTEVPYKKLWYFPIGKRIQRLYMSTKIAEHMTWHSKCQGLSDRMIHPAQSETWQRFNIAHPEFAAEERNVRVGLSTDGFCPNDSVGSAYSCWPVFITPYNLPPNMCMREEFIFMSLMISGPSSPKNKIDVLLRPLIDELKSLWSDGVVTWDSIKKENFQMRVAVMWTISDFPAYGMLSGWSTHGRLSCPYCQGDTDAFYLENGHKQCWFDCHRAFLPNRHPMRYNTEDFIYGKTVEKVMQERKSTVDNRSKLDEFPSIDITREGEKFPGKGVDHNFTKESIFWELPYWVTLLVPHILDVMHCEKNFFDNLLHTIMEHGRASKDNRNARLDLEVLTGRQSLFMKEGNTSRKTKAAYTVTAAQRRAICEWLKELRFPDGHVSNLQSNAKIDDNRIKGLKTHDCHVFMQRLLPIAFKELLPEVIWEPLVEVSNAFRSICGSEVSASAMEELGKKVVKVLCKLEMIFPPAFFDCMEHLLIHLPYEAQVCGPVFYHWMYPFERKLGILKKMARQKNRLEGSICEAYLIREIMQFCNFFFDEDKENSVKRLRRNETVCNPQFPGQLSIFIPKGKPLNRAMKRKILSISEYDQALLCIVMNCPELFDLTSQFEGYIPNNLSRRRRELYRISNLLSWLRGLNANGGLGNEEIEFIFDGGSYTVLELQGYTVNGLKFETEKYGTNKTTMNYGVCVKTENENANGTTKNYYGVLKEIIQLSFNCPGRDVQQIHLFKCDWFDNKYVTIDRLGLVSLSPEHRIVTNEPYILADLASQVFYCEYPYMKLGRRHRKVWAVCPVRARHSIDLSSMDEQQPNQPNQQNQEPEEEFYQDEAPPTSELFVDFTSYNLQIDLADTNGEEVDAE